MSVHKFHVVVDLQHNLLKLMSLLCLKCTGYIHHRIYKPLCRRMVAHSVTWHTLALYIAKLHESSYSKLKKGGNKFFFWDKTLFGNLQLGF